MSWFKKSQNRFTKPLPGLAEMEKLAEVNFTPRATQVLAHARNEADRLHHNFVGTEHVLLGLIKLGQGVAVNVLAGFGLDLETVRAEVEKQVGTGPDQKNTGNAPYIPRVKKVIALAQKEAKALNHTYVGTEHLLLGLLREGEGVAAKVMQNLNVDIEQTRQKILHELDPNYVPASDDGAGSRETTASQSRLGTFSLPEPIFIDTRKRYDVYCAEHNQTVAYRNALLKGFKSISKSDRFDRASHFFELEQANGQAVFIPRSSIIKFCEHGAMPGGEIVPDKKPE